MSVVVLSYCFPAHLVSSSRGIPDCALGVHEFAAIGLSNSLTSPCESLNGYIQPSGGELLIPMH